MASRRVCAGARREGRERTILRKLGRARRTRAAGRKRSGGPGASELAGSVSLDGRRAGQQQVKGVCAERVTPTSSPSAVIRREIVFL